jgi:hypothetical protein
MASLSRSLMGRVSTFSNSTDIVPKGTIVIWRTDETIPVGFGTIQVLPIWRFLLAVGRIAIVSSYPKIPDN